MHTLTLDDTEHAFLLSTLQIMEQLAGQTPLVGGGATRSDKMKTRRALDRMIEKVTNA